MELQENKVWRNARNAKLQMKSCTIQVKEEGEKEENVFF